MAAPSTSAALAASSRLIALISSSFLPSRHARADSPRSPKLRHTTVTCAPRDAASAIAPPARQTKSPAWALITRTGPFSAAASAVIFLPPSRALGLGPRLVVPEARQTAEREAWGSGGVPPEAAESRRRDTATA